jgi:hypothetical protein
MPVTISYDLANLDNNERNYIRSALERFGWHRIGGSVFRYDGIAGTGGDRVEDWLNDVTPALAFLRSFILRRGITINTFTIDAHSVAMIDLSDANVPLGSGPKAGKDLLLATPTNNQSAEKALRDFVDGCTGAAPAK